MSTSELISTGILMGIIDVLTGPDHLSALATLCGTNIQTHNNLNHSRREAFFLGIRWGVGHSFGLLIVGGLLIVLEESSGEWIGMDPVLSTILECFVGVFMIALGSYGLFKANRNHRESAVSVAMLSNERYKGQFEIINLQEEDFIGSRNSTNSNDDVEIVTKMESVLKDDSSRARSAVFPLDGSLTSRISQGLSRWPSRSDLLDENEMEDHESYDEQSSSHLSFETVHIRQPGAAASMLHETKPPSTNSAKLMTATSLMSNHTSPDHSGILSVSEASRKSGLYCFQYLFCCGTIMGDDNNGRSTATSTTTPGLLALVSGVVHGVAGPGGVLGVIPAAQLRNAKLAIVYLGTFCLTSTCVMGGFAVF